VFSHWQYKEEEKHRQLHALLARTRISTDDKERALDGEGQGGWERAPNPSAPPLSSPSPPASLYGGGSEAVTMGAILEELRLLTVENLELHGTCKELKLQLLPPTSTPASSSQDDISLSIP